MAISGKNQRWAWGAEAVPPSGPSLPGKAQGPRPQCFEAKGGQVEGRLGGATERREGTWGGASFSAWAPLQAWQPCHSLAPFEGSEDCRTSVHSCMVLCRAWVFSLSTWT